MNITITARVFPTEDKDKIIEHISSIFPEATFEENDDLIIGKTNDVRQFRKLVEQQRIRNTIESILMQNYVGGKTRILLNKQCKGIVNVYEENELGPIEVIIEGTEDEIKKMVWGNGD
ncbi:MAG: hypothetical protein J7K68_03330 [Candidatus Diapherotrites archaeon]|nr:hypothetical protein [Candidatus Diapherotrites archaeon]